LRIASRPAARNFGLLDRTPPLVILGLSATGAAAVLLRAPVAVGRLVEATFPVVRKRM